MRLGQPAGDRQTQPCSFLARGEKRVEYSREILLGYPRPIIPDAYDRLTVLLAQRDLDPPPGPYRLRSIEQQIQQYLFQRTSIAAHGDRRSVVRWEGERRPCLVHHR